MLDEKITSLEDKVNDAVLPPSDWTGTGDKDLDNKFNSLRRELNELRVKNSDLEQKTEALQTQDEIQQAKYNDLEERFEAMKSQNDIQETKITELETRLNSGEFGSSSQKEQVYLLAHSNDYQSFSSNYRFKFNRILSNKGIYK